ncbi:MAG: hypothetical protein HYV07_17990 [Deltaproteobacteria bacterium]|nr:hypothetical protein [Deltaproteobacteria bacterium]
MKRLAPYALALGALAASPAQATTTRVYTLGAMNRFVIDDANRWLWPHTALDYSNLFYLELFGSGPSDGFAAPTSKRGANDAPGAMLTGAELTAVQSTAGGGFILKLMDELAIGAHLSDFENPAVVAFLSGPVAAYSIGDPNAFPYLTGGAVRPVSSANRKFDIFAAYDIPDALQLGLLLTYGSSKYGYFPNPDEAPVQYSNGTEVARARDDLGASEFRMLVSTGLPMGEEAKLDLGVGFGLHTLSYSPNALDAELLYGGDGFELQADLRALIGVAEHWELVPAISFRSLGFSAEDLAAYGAPISLYTDNGAPATADINRTEVSQSTLLFDIGVAAHYHPVEVVDFWGAAGFELLRASTSFVHNYQETSDLPRPSPGGGTPGGYEVGSLVQNADAFPYLKIGLEAQLFSWLDGRAGAIKYLRADKTTTTGEDDQNNLGAIDNDATVDKPFFDYFVGLAAHYQGFFLDMQLDPSWFMRGPYLLSGAGGPMFVNASAGYKY